MNSSPVFAQKYLLRLRARRRLQEMDASFRIRKSALILKRLFSLSVYKKAENIFLYIAQPEEVQTMALAKRALGDGKQVFAPRLKADGHQLAVCQITRLPGDLKKGRHGILEPRGRAINKLQDLDLIIMPGLAFDRAGGRLGRGLGYFDRFLKKVKKIPKIGLAYREQMVKRVPMEKHDVSADKVITD